MTRIYVEPSALLLSGGRPSDTTASGPLQSGAGAALHELTDAGHDVFVVGTIGTVSKALRDIAPAVGLVPDELPDPAWLLTSHAADCAHRRARLQTILVGPPPHPVGGHVLRCDIDARDLWAAVMEILAREAMPR